MKEVNAINTKKRRGVKRIIIYLILFIYLGSGLLGFVVVKGVVFSKRVSSIDSLEDLDRRIYKLRSDYNVLNEREEIYFKSEKNTLCGYLYSVEDSKGLVIGAHGINSLSDGTESQIYQWFVSLGYSVFAIDLTASGKSEGQKIKGLDQSAIDVKNAYLYLKENGLLQENIVLIGYSWGGFGVAASIQMGVKCDYLITFSAFDNPMETMLVYGKESAGLVSYIYYPIFYISSLISFGNGTNIRASNGLVNRDIKCLIIQGKEDKTVKYNYNSLYNKTLGYDNVSSLLLEDIGHDGPWRSVDSHSYADSLKERINELKGESIEEKDRFLATIDKEKSSELSEIVFNKIEEFLK